MMPNEKDDIFSHLTRNTFANVEYLKKYFAIVNLPKLTFILGFTCKSLELCIIIFVKRSMECSSIVSIATFGYIDPGKDPGWFAVSNSNQKLSF